MGENKARICILLAPGINCDHETAYAVELAGGIPVRCHINDMILGRIDIDAFHGLVIPGGFAFGDDIASGKILGNKLKYLLWPTIENFIAEGKPILGICNGFQVMAKMGLLPGFDLDYRTQRITLTFNASNRFEDRWIHLMPEPSSPCIFTKNIERILALPIRHGEGRLLTADEVALKRLEDGAHVALRYVDKNGISGVYPVNPNGSVNDIAGICDDTGLLFGLMPHPEAFVRNTQHPQWTRQTLAREGDGLSIFRNMIEYIELNLL